jgi:hypothetical protein
LIRDGKLCVREALLLFNSPRPEVIGAFKRGVAPLLIFFPLSLKGEGDKGGEGDNNHQNLTG